ncbi:MAG TPA: DUF4443 domain-containing protein [Ignisphaera sp.]|uniref:DUF4443 domain-containing protein n=1 Tax=Ignisphaera aggregans TaxID=334771 RepID=A0A832YZX8_9CREN|nr:DUF4443 domain-containing protein [Ignisphaera sp.]HIP57642.1 DUF4443 domain-containing protein [Ignisphaera aggregans]
MQLRDAVNVFRKLVEARGHVKPMYSEYHVLKALLVIERREPIGRHALSRELRLGIASTRTLLRRLREVGIVGVDPVAGCFLTEYGREIVSSIRKMVKRIERVSQHIGQDLALDTEAYAALIAPQLVENYSVIELRDLFVRCGASAALVIRVRNGIAALLPDYVANEYSLKSLQIIRKALSADEGDYIVVTYASTEPQAEEALYKGLTTLLLRYWSSGGC